MSIGMNKTKGRLVGVNMLLYSSGSNQPNQLLRTVHSGSAAYLTYLVAPVGRSKVLNSPKIVIRGGCTDCSSSVCLANSIGRIGHLHIQHETLYIYHVHSPTKAG